MALRDKIVSGPLRPPPKTCAVCWAQTWVPQDDVEVLDMMLHDAARYPANIVAQSMRDEYDMHVGGDAVGRHRRLHMGAQS